MRTNRSCTLPRLGIAAIGLALLFGGPAGAVEGAATFLDGVYAPAKDCVVHELLPQSKWNLYTAPDYYDSSGWYGWETDCKFTAARQLSPEKWEATLECLDHGSDEKTISKPVFERLDEREFVVTFKGSEENASSESDSEDETFQIFHCKKVLGTE